MATTLEVPQRTIRPAARSASRWTLQQSPPADWPALTRDLDGGFFHDTRALELGGHDGQRIVALLHGDQVDGIAVGLRYRCRLSAKLRHAYFPSLPRFREGVDARAAIESLRAAVADAGASDITFDAFDATVAADHIGEPGLLRNEYIVDLTREPDLIRGFATNHQRHVKRGERDGWRHEVSLADTAAAAVALVAESASTRATARGRGFSAATLDLTRVARLCDDHWGVAVHSAFAGDTLLSAALIGRGGTRAFYLVGGSTPEGYSCSAATWLHWRAMQSLRAMGITRYNLGGAPAGALDPGHISHGLHRFKAGLGADLVPLRGFHWIDASLHSRLHRAARRFSASHSFGGHAA